MKMNPIQSKMKFDAALNRLNDENILLKELATEHSAAIQYILRKMETNCTQVLSKMGISRDHILEIQHDGLILFIRKIKDGSYDAKLSAPITYVTAICKNLGLNYLRSKNHVAYSELEEYHHPFKNTTEDTISIAETSFFVNKLLSEIGSPCKELLQLKYIDGYSDDEQIEKQLTSFTSSASLRVSRSQCMKKISVLSQKYKSSYEN